MSDALSPPVSARTASDAVLLGVKNIEVIYDHVILVLKGSPTVIGAPDGQVHVNTTGNAGMATGGTGDVLTGMIASFIAQKLDDPLGATIAAVYLHGLAGDIAASVAGTRAMIASDISSHLGKAFIAVGGDAERFI